MHTNRPDESCVGEVDDGIQTDILQTNLERPREHRLQAVRCLKSVHREQEA